MQEERQVQGTNAIRPVPVTLVTGFLGSGKTTLLKRILEQRRDVPIAVIENEFGDAGIDDRLLRESPNAEIVALRNGCVCCTVRADLINALVALHKKRNSRTLHFERVIIETTGLAGVVELAHALVRDEAIAAHYRLDAIVTMVDARHGQRQLDDFPEAQEQIAIADRILISKTDLVSEDEESRLLRRIASLNARAPVARAHFGETPAADILDIRAFDTTAAFAVEARDHVQQGHAERIGSFAFRTSRSFNATCLDAFLSAMIDLYGPDMLRYKGVLHLDGHPEQVILQGVQTVLRVEMGAAWPPKDARRSVLVFIGRDLPKDVFLRALERCLQEPSATLDCAPQRAYSNLARERGRACA